MPTKNTTKVFSSFKESFNSQPKLDAIQKNSFAWLESRGLKELFSEISPVSDYTGKEFDLFFDDYYFDQPKYTEEQSRYKDTTYEAALRAKLRLVNKITKEADTQEVYLGDFPIMTGRGTFIINGVERVVVSQLVRSPGVYFTANMFRGRKLFGAKIIPNRGAWIEFESESTGIIGVKIDRNRKVPVTSLLRIFGFETDEQILKAFNKVSELGKKIIKASLEKDSAKDVSTAYLEIYKRIRPGDLATVENAKNLIDNMFKNDDRYDLSEVGRFKLNQRLGVKNRVNRLLSQEDILDIVKEIIHLNDVQTEAPDDIDHLGNRRIRPIGELFQNRLRVGFARMRRVIQDRMSTLDKDSLNPAQLINPRLLMAISKEFYSSSQLSQFMDQINPLAELEHKRRLSSMGPGGLIRERAGFEVRDVHSSYYGRICPIHTPEGSNIGLVNHLANFSRVNSLGFLETPYYKVENGLVTKNIEWLDAFNEEKYKIAPADTKLSDDGKILSSLVEVRIKGTAGTCANKEVDFMDVAPHQFVSIATSLIPFLKHDDANRALMGSNMQKQAVIPLVPESPFVSTGVEEIAARDSGYLVIAEEKGEVLEVDASGLKVKYEKAGNKEYKIEKFKRSNQFGSISQRPLVKKGSTFKKGDILVDGPSSENGVLALGHNLLVAFLSFEGANFEDAIVISERAAQRDVFSSIHIENFYCDVRDTKLGPEITTPDIPNISEDKLKNLDEEGIIRVGAEVKVGDILVGKISPKGESELTSEERLLRAIFGEKARDVKDTSLTIPHGKYGRIIGIKVFSREHGDSLDQGVIKRIQVEVAQIRKVRVGDKLAGRHGNKGVISQIRAVEDMPYLADGTPVDIVLNPLGVVSRMNLGQILETHLGWAASRLGYRAITPSLSGATETEIQAELTKAGLPKDGKIDLYSGQTGEKFDNKVTVGYIYMIKLNHLVEDKIHSRSIGPYSLITQQPLGGKAQFGGQRFGEMEVWALQGYGAAHILQEMLTIKSDDIIGRSATFESIIRGEKIKSPNLPASFNVLISELKSLGFNIEKQGDAEYIKSQNQNNNEDK
ncbi:MAG: DNA-directed RNA polymerase subunit beta [Candidatus Liptonbacteria bacterium CG11_big_fil_rev_8_21_14_0_20_35_14]|uniref:DNA-directed RNA polymerase subunit beta n=1 Tax=Candidatus Liptonbacteria bacterium CG11_big_fil_rev_8_21_14_0_20_35_14 TaxID=1974634 RepID=A0A2H0N6V0_9BACT|nr:MAG: DNA-directed RNA polymerase subunit beta [Candidatus Liptonbacteria bacterium CG11_big_fil_rev_8_21_14_0_20_35_14]